MLRLFPRPQHSAVCPYIGLSGVKITSEQAFAYLERAEFVCGQPESDFSSRRTCDMDRVNPHVVRVNCPCLFFPILTWERYASSKRAMAG